MWSLQRKQQRVVQYVSPGLYLSLCPWLGMLELYHCAGRQAEFQVLSQRLHTDFNLQRVPWPGDTEGGQRAGLSLENHPHIVRRLTATWGQETCLPYVRNLVEDNGGGSRIGFSLGAFEEVLMLAGLLEAGLPQTGLHPVTQALRAASRGYALDPRRQTFQRISSGSRR